MKQVFNIRNKFNISKKNAHLHKLAFLYLTFIFMPLSLENKA